MHIVIIIILCFEAIFIWKYAFIFDIVYRDADARIAADYANSAMFCFACNRGLTPSLVFPTHARPTLIP